MVFCVGLTGTIGSGKSLVAQLFAKKDITVISADIIAKNLTLAAMPAYKKIVTHFGDQILLPSLELNRALLRTILIEKPQERIWLEQLLHPLIQLQIQEDIKSSASRYCIIEIPLLYKKEDFPYLHRILIVTSPKDLTLKRVMQRDNCSKKEAVALLSIQEKKVQPSIADDIIVNDKTIEDVEDAVAVLHQHYLKLSLTPLHNS